ncbi:hypothetical protein [Ideonella alba]|uniref:Lipoprotein n=1 Tax=Ideonella alba TaxID=2824118 RepID=A0A941BLG5_9BURK|nr:hypothetical protein [Ideonella alba]MBQ0931174.1 hypothetical protein [Ideonella alba]
MKYTVIAVALVAALSGCGQKANGSFADVPYGSTRADLEKAGFTCRKEADTEFTCVNLNWKGTVFGRQMRKLAFSRQATGDGSSVVVEMAEAPRGPGDIKLLERDIDQVCQRDARWDYWTEGTVALAWNCRDGSFLKFFYDAAAGGIPARASFSSDSPS